MVQITTHRAVAGMVAAHLHKKYLKSTDGLVVSFVLASSHCKGQITNFVSVNCGLKF